MLDDPDVDGEKIFLAMFAIIFAAFGAGQAATYGPDAAKAVAPAMKIFKITDTPTKINAVDIPENAIEVPETFQGTIEFKNVWFRYPMRPKHWVFKGLNLKINPKDSIAIVGESGQGKSTLILLLMRFYDIDKGDILIDGISIKDYNIASLR
jgi:ABC-type multidrug transport system fused ATPase/permease subunit